MGFSHRVKRMDFLGRRVAVVLQNENGPCPLIGIANVLLLRGTLKIHEDRSEVNTEQLIGWIGDIIMERNPPLADENLRENQQKTLDDVMDILPTLEFGLDVNVKFSGVGSFEFDAKIAVFDMLDINLYHGWLVDPNDEEAMKVLSPMSYNQLIDKIIMADHVENSTDYSEDQKEEIRHEAALAQKFLSDTSSQLTYYGLVELYDNIKNNETAVFFRNNHFSTMFKKDDDLYILLTDHGYEKQNTIGWELLSEIDGNTEIVSPEFGDPNQYIQPADLLVGTDQEADRLLAQQLQEQENAAAGVPNGNFAEAPPRPMVPPPSGLDGIDVDEQRRALEQIQRQRGGNNNNNNNNNGGNNNPRVNSFFASNYNNRGTSPRNTSNGGCTIS